MMFCATAHCAFLLAHWATEGRAQGQDSLTIPHEHYTLANGLRVVLAEDHTAPVVAVDVWYHVGSRDEVVSRTGFAHLFEHLMFQGSPGHPGEYIAPLERIGANVNGSTNVDRTNYYEVVPSAYLPMALFLEGDRMRGLLETVDQDKLDNQREVVRNERRQRVENVPYGDVRILLAEILFPTGHGYHHPTIGSHTDLEAASLQDVHAFFKQHYAPSNAVLTIVGDFDPSTAKDLVERWLSDIPGGSAGVATSPNAPDLPYGVVRTVFRDVPHRRVWLAWHAPAWGTREDAELELLASILGDGRDGVLVDALVANQGIARQLTVRQQSSGWSSVFVVSASAADGVSTDTLVAAIDRELAAFVSLDPAGLAPSLQAAVATTERDFRFSLETNLGKAEALQSCFQTTGRFDCVHGLVSLYTSATPAAVMATAKATLAAPRVALHVLPMSDRAGSMESPVQAQAPSKQETP